MQARPLVVIAASVTLLACTKSAVSIGPAASASVAAPLTSSIPDASLPGDASRATESVDASSVPSTYTGNDWPSLAALTNTGIAARDALVAHDMHRFAGLVHPTRGVRFSPYAYVDAKADVVLHANEIEPAFASNAKRTWGSFDGSGEPIVLTLRSYLARFVAFSELAQLAPRLNATIATGNTFNNQSEVYGNAPYVEYYRPAKSNGMDWEALRIVFEPVNGKLYVVGVIHDVWTI